MGREGLGEFELMVMLAAMHLGEENAHALTIAGAIRKRTGRSTHRAAVYVTLQRLERKGLVSTWLGEPRPERGGKPRRHVRVEATGARAVRETRAALESMWRDLSPAWSAR